MPTPSASIWTPETPNLNPNPAPNPNPNPNPNPTDMFRHTQKILDAWDRLPDPLTQKADAVAKCGANATLHMSQDGTVWLKLYNTIVARSDREGLWAAHGGHRTATTMLWLLSALQAFQGRGGYFQRDPVTGHRTGGAFEVGGVELEGKGLSLVQRPS